MWFTSFKVTLIRSIFLGRALLFKRVVNLTYTGIQDRVMLTGRHMVRDVMCKNCKTKLGWMYEYATEESQKWVSPALLSIEWAIFSMCIILFFRYKEGRVILEQALIQESDGFPDPYSAPTPVATNRYNNQNHFPE